MVRLWEGGAYLLHGTELIAEQDASAQIKNTEYISTYYT